MLSFLQWLGKIFLQLTPLLQPVLIQTLLQPVFNISQQGFI